MSYINIFLATQILLKIILQIKAITFSNLAYLLCMLISEKYIDVILPLPVKGTFTYATFEDDILVGQRVIVQFGVRKLYSGIVKEIHTNKSTDYDAKPIIAVMDEAPIVNSKQLQFWDWIADYYMCNLGDVMNAALPSSFKLASESKVIIHPEFDGDVNDLKEVEINLVNALAHKEELSIDSIIKLLNIKNVFTLINELIRKEIVQLKEDLHDKYNQKKVRIVSFIADDEKLKTTKLTVKQQEFIDEFLLLNKQNTAKKWTVPLLLKATGLSRGILNALVKKEILKIYNIYFPHFDQVKMEKKEQLPLGQFLIL